MCCSRGLRKSCSSYICCEKIMDIKRRRYFHLEDADGKQLANGVLYDEGNVQVLWRVDSGYTAEQYASLNLILDLMPGITVLRLEDTESESEESE